MELPERARHTTNTHETKLVHEIKGLRERATLRWASGEIDEEHRNEIEAALSAIETAAPEERDGAIELAYASGLLTEAECNTLRKEKHEDAEPHAEEKAAETVSQPDAAGADAGAREVVEHTAQNPTARHAAVEVAMPGATVEEKEKTEAELASEPAQKKLVQRIKEFFTQHNPYSSWKGSWKELAAGSATGALIRSAIRLSYGSSLGVGIAAGAAAGVGAGLTREILRQRKLLVAENVIQKVRESKNLGPEGRAALLAKAKKAHDDALLVGDKEQIQLFGEELREMIIFTTTETEQMEGSPQKDKILNILKIAAGARKDVKKDQRGKAEELINAVLFERATLDRKKIAGAVVRGAAIGALGGYLGGLAADWISDHIHAGSDAGKATMTAAAEKIRASTEETAREAAEKATNVYLAAEAAARATREAVERANTDLLAHQFSTVVEKGEGATHVARRLIHEYLVNAKHLDSEAFQNIATEHLVHAEDTLQRQLATGALAVGQRFDTSGETIQGLLEKSAALTPEKLENIARILKEPAHHLSRGTIDYMNTFDSPVSEANSVSAGLIRNIEDAAREAARASAKEAGAAATEQATHEGVRSATQAAPEAATSVLSPESPTEHPRATTALLRKIAAGAGLSALGLGGTWYMIRQSIKDTKSERAGAPTEEEAQPSALVAPAETATAETESAPSAPEVVAPGKPAARREEREEAPPDRHRETRSATQITLARIKDYKDLWAGTEKEGDERFKERTRELWTEFATHGMYGGVDAAGKRIILPKTNFDGRSTIGLLSLAGFNTKNITYVAPGERVSGAINFNTGNEHGVVVREDGKIAVIDHHAEWSGSDTSAAEKTYQLLVELGLLEKTEAVDRLIAMVNYEDNKTYPDTKKYYEDSWRTIIGLKGFMKFEKLLGLLKAGMDPMGVLTEQELKTFGLEQYSKTRKRDIDKSRKMLEWLESGGLIIPSARYGKIVPDVGGKMIPTGFDAVLAHGYGAYIIWSPKEQAFFISTKNRLTDEFGQGQKVRETMWIKNRGDGVPLSVSLEEVLSKMTDGTFKPTKLFKEFLKEYGGVVKK